ncbi:sensor domain-containing diguanylate cyclase [Halomonas sp. YLGW01]|uniref:sensor domain-containing diguanylate cyclase n=1 Tax=Halomonas sp. YLGW01 TaxID=2773308 RepID=UPI001786F9DD|nr:sensor domain-containing diguanylate cyclase [Halomonas sp. YLGW01]
MSEIDVAALLAKSSDPTCVLGAEDEILEVNRALADALGQSADSLRGQAFVSLLAPEDREAGRAALVAAGAVSLRARLGAAGDACLEVTWRLTPRLDGQRLCLGQPVIAAPQAIDPLLGQLARHVPGVIYQYRIRPDGSSHFPYVSARFEELFDLPAAAVRDDAASLFARAHPEDLPRIVESIDQAARALTPWHCRYRYCRPDGRVRWHEGNATLERQADGSLLCHGYITDITARHELEAALEEERLRLSNILEGTHAGAWEWDVVTGEMHVNARWAEMLGHALAELEPVSFATFEERVHPEDMAQVRRRLEAHFSGARDFYEVELRMHHRDGHWVWVLAHGKVFRWSEQGRPLMMAGIHQEIGDRKDAEAALKRLATTDPLTGLWNRRHFLQQLGQAFDRCQRYGRISSVILVDIDHFKRINDSHGHEAGDRVIQCTAEVLSAWCRHLDVPARIGGEEFALLLTDTDERGAHALAERIRHALQAMAVTYGDASLHLTASLGIAAMGVGDRHHEDCMRQADRALYAAKNGGRNRVEVASALPSGVGLEHP